MALAYCLPGRPDLRSRDKAGEDHRITIIEEFAKLHSIWSRNGIQAFVSIMTLCRFYSRGPTILMGALKGWESRAHSTTMMILLNSFTNFSQPCS